MRVTSLVLVALIVSATKLAAQDETPPAGVESKILPVEGKVVGLMRRVLDIKGASGGIEGTLADLGAKVTEREIRIDLSADVLFVTLRRRPRLLGLDERVGFRRRAA